MSQSVKSLIKDLQKCVFNLNRAIICCNRHMTLSLGNLLKNIDPVTQILGRESVRSNHKTPNYMRGLSSDM